MTPRSGAGILSHPLKLAAMALVLAAVALTAGYLLSEYDVGRAKQQPQPPPPSEKVVNAPGPDNTITTLDGKPTPPQPAVPNEERRK